MDLQVPWSGFWGCEAPGYARGALPPVACSLGRRCRPPWAPRQRWQASCSHCVKQQGDRVAPQSSNGGAGGGRQAHEQRLLLLALLLPPWQVCVHSTRHTLAAGWRRRTMRRWGSAAAWRRPSPRACLKQCRPQGSSRSSPSRWVLAAAHCVLQTGCCDYWIAPCTTMLQRRSLSAWHCLSACGSRETAAQLLHCGGTSLRLAAAALSPPPPPPPSAGCQVVGGKEKIRPG